MRRCARLARRRSISPRRAAGGNRRGVAAAGNHYALAPTRQRAGILTADSSITDPTTNPTRNAPGLKSRGLRSTSMNLHCQPLGDVTLTRPSGTLSRRERGWLHADSAIAISVRQRGLSSIELQLQQRYRYCVQNGGGAYIDDRFVRTESLRTKGAYISGSDVRTCNFNVIANLLRLEPAERRGGRSLQKAISVPEVAVRSRRAAGVSRLLRRPSNERSSLRSRTNIHASKRSKRNGGLTAPARLTLDSRNPRCRT
jgi:hypothetical protein